MSQDAERQPLFLSIEQVEEIHTEQIRLFGGSHGINSRELLESAVVAPQQLYCYGDAECDIFDWAASYCSHLAKNHAFTDGNKRTAFAAAVTFLEVNGIEFPRRSEGSQTVRFSDAMIASFVERHITGHVGESVLSELLYQPVSYALLEDAIAEAGQVNYGEKTFPSEEERIAYCADLFLTSVTLALIKSCERLFINPRRIHDTHQAGTDGITRNLDPHFQRVFGLIPSDETPPSK